MSQSAISVTMGKTMFFEDFGLAPQFGFIHNFLSQNLNLHIGKKVLVL